jgi:putative ABC transport system substrate-binding protein
MIRRRDFITLLGGTAAAWPIAARAQQTTRVRRLGWLWPFDENDPSGKVWMAAVVQGLAELGWTEGRNLQIDIRWNPKTPEEARKFTQELIALQPEVLVTGVPSLVRAVQQETRTIPIVFLGAGDPLGGGLVTSIPHPGGNTTGVTDRLPGLGSKSLELLKDCVPGLTRAALVFEGDVAPGSVRSAAEAGVQYGVKTIEMRVHNLDEIERAIASFAAEPGGGVIVGPPPLPGPYRKLINGLAIRYGLPVIWRDRTFAVEGGLLAYGTDMLYMFRHDGPPYIDRILRGAKPGELPVQFPAKFILTVNTTTARAMGSRFRNLSLPAPTRSSNEFATPRLHHASRRCGCGLAAGGDGAAGRSAQTAGDAVGRARKLGIALRKSVAGRACPARLGRRAKSPRRLSDGGKQRSGGFAIAGGRDGALGPGRHLCLACNRCAGSATPHQQHPHRVCTGRRSCARRDGTEPGKARPQHHRLRALRSVNEHEVPPAP